VFAELSMGFCANTVPIKGDLPPGDYTVTVDSFPDGYEVVGDATLTVTVEAGQTAQVQIRVKKALADQPAGTEGGRINPNYSFASWSQTPASAAGPAPRSRLAAA
jgi:hypothetical protein